MGERSEFQKDLYMPVNAPDADDVIQGVGSFELYVYVLSFFLCAGLGIWIYAVSASSMLALVTAIGVFSISVMVFRRDVYNENFIKKIKVMVAFVKGSKKYEYRYHNIYEGETELDEETD